MGHHELQRSKNHSHSVLGILARRSNHQSWDTHLRETPISINSPHQDLYSIPCSVKQYFSYVLPDSLSWFLPSPAGLGMGEIIHCLSFRGQYFSVQFIWRLKPSCLDAMRLNPGRFEKDMNHLAIRLLWMRTLRDLQAVGVYSSPARVEKTHVFQCFNCKCSHPRSLDPCFSQGDFLEL